MPIFYNEITNDIEIKPASHQPEKLVFASPKPNKYLYTKLLLVLNKMMFLKL